jgi:hypothetical protein
VCPGQATSPVSLGHLPLSDQTAKGFCFSRKAEVTPGGPARAILASGLVYPCPMTAHLRPWLIAIAVLIVIALAVLILLAVWNVGQVMHDLEHVAPKGD